MLHRKRFVLGLSILLGCTLTAAACGPAASPVPQQVSQAGTAKNQLHVGGFYVDEQGPYNSYYSLQKYAGQLDELFPFWYSIQPDGSIQGNRSEKVVSLARKNHVRVVPMFNVAKARDTFLHDPQTRQKAAANIASIVKKNGYDGALIDAQFVPGNAGEEDFRHIADELTDFMRTTRKDLGSGKELDAAVLPHVQVPAEMSGVYQYKPLAGIVDRMTLMAYDQHSESSTAGPVAPFDWVESSIQQMIKEGVSPSKIYLGVASYGYNWHDDQSGGFSQPTEEILKQARQRGADVRWDTQHKEPYYIYYGPNGTQRKVYFESSSTLKQKIALAQKYKLYGIALWRMGFEDPSFWSAIKQTVPQAGNQPTSGR